MKQDGQTHFYFFAVCSNEISLFKLLLHEQPELLNTQDELGMTSYHYACYFQHSQLQEHLLEKGVDTQVKDKKGFTPLDYLNMRSSTMKSSKYYQFLGLHSPNIKPKLSILITEPYSEFVLKNDFLIVLDLHGFKRLILKCLQTIDTSLSYENDIYHHHLMGAHIMTIAIECCKQYTNFYDEIPSILFKNIKNLKTPQLVYCISMISRLMYLTGLDLTKIILNLFENLILELPDSFNGKKITAYLKAVSYFMQKSLWHVCLQNYFYNQVGYHYCSKIQNQFLQSKSFTREASLEFRMNLSVIEEILPSGIEWSVKNWPLIKILQFLQVFTTFARNKGEFFDWVEQCPLIDDIMMIYLLRYYKCVEGEEIDEGIVIHLQNKQTPNNKRHVRSATDPLMNRLNNQFQRFRNYLFIDEYPKMDESWILPYNLEKDIGKILLKEIQDMLDMYKKDYKKEDEAYLWITVEQYERIIHSL
eukprot:NODE_997_length_2419_cov_0.367672.p1 type:complete len:474 gc:universal NODE_997_length_2419_cov_0.367672:631-2052(+)